MKIRPKNQTKIENRSVEVSILFIRRAFKVQNGEKPSIFLKIAFVWRPLAPIHGHLSTQSIGPREN